MVHSIRAAIILPKYCFKLKDEQRKERIEDEIKSIALCRWNGCRTSHIAFSNSSYKLLADRKRIDLHRYVSLEICDMNSTRIQAEPRKVFPLILPSPPSADQAVICKPTRQWSELDCLEQSIEKSSSHASALYGVFCEPNAKLCG